MESIHIVGGLKAEPSEIQYLVPASGTSVEINVGDICSDSDENEEVINVGIKDSGLGQSVSNMEGVVIADAHEDEMETRRQIFNYVGYNKDDKTKKANLKQQETYNFNYTRNEDLLFYTDHFRFRRESEMAHENGQLKEEPHIESTSDNDVANEIKSGSQQNKNRKRSATTASPRRRKCKKRCKDNDINLAEAVFTDGSPECIELSSDNDVSIEINSDSEQNDHSVDTIMNRPSTSVQNDDEIINKHIYLAEAVFKDDLSWKEYSMSKGWYICKHCRFKDTLQNIKNHIIAVHRKTQTKQCPFCDVKTKVLAYHIRMYHKNVYRTPECIDILKKSANLKIIESTSENDVNNEINTNSEQNNHSVDTIMNHSTATVQNNDKKSREQAYLAEALLKDDLSLNEYRESKGWYICKHCGYKDSLQNVKKHIITKHRKTETKQQERRMDHKNMLRSLECNDIPNKSCKLEIIESTSDNDVNNEINSDSGQNDHSVDTIMNQSTTAVQSKEKRSAKHIYLAEREFKDDLSWKEYREKSGWYSCKRCRHKDTLENIKKHIIEKHRKTETKQCPFCNVKTKVLTYHIRMYHKNMGWSPKCSQSTSDNNVENEIKSDSQQNKISNSSTTTVRRRRPSKKYKKKEINLAEAVFKDDLYSREYIDVVDGSYKLCYRCKHCHLRDTLENIKVHIIENHRKTEKKQCPFCNVKTHVLTYHLRVYHNNMNKCPECDYVGKNGANLKMHINKIHQIDLPKCDKCDEIFTSKYHLYAHDLRHHREHQIYHCAHCDFSGKHRRHFIIHLKRHREDPREIPTLLCDQCDFRTKDKRSFRAHRANHENPKLVCDQCGHKSGSPFHLNLHLISHKKQPDADDLRHHCDQCDYKTHRIYSLTVHKLNHLKPEEIKYFYCYHCNFKAKRKDNLKSHIWKLHFQKETLTLKCSICPFTTTKKHLLVKHVNKHSKDMNPL